MIGMQVMMHDVRLVHKTGGVQSCVLTGRVHGTVGPRSLERAASRHSQPGDRTFVTLAATCDGPGPDNGVSG